MHGDCSQLRVHFRCFVGGKHGVTKHNWFTIAKKNHGSLQIEIKLI